MGSGESDEHHKRTYLYRNMLENPVQGCPGPRFFGPGPLLLFRRSGRRVSGPGPLFLFSPRSLSPTTLLLDHIYQIWSKRKNKIIRCRWEHWSLVNGVWKFVESIVIDNIVFNMEKTLSAEMLLVELLEWKSVTTMAVARSSY